MSGPTHSSPSTDLITANQLTDYQFITEPLQTDTNGVALRCASGLGPPGGDRSLSLGGWYFGVSKINVGIRCSRPRLQVRSANRNHFPGVINLYPCGSLSADEEGVYSCMMMNSSMMVQTTRVGLYRSGRSESVDVYPITSLLTIFHLCTQLLQ